MLTRASNSFKLLSKQCKKLHDNSFIFLAPNLWNLGYYLHDSIIYLTNFNAFLVM